MKEGRKAVRSWMSREVKRTWEELGRGKHFQNILHKKLNTNFALIKIADFFLFVVCMRLYMCRERVGMSACACVCVV